MTALHLKNKKRIICCIKPFPGEFCTQTTTSSLFGTEATERVVLIKQCFAAQVWSAGAVAQPDVEAHKLGLIELFYCWILFYFKIH